jgi:hypothetical protein
MPVAVKGWCLVRKEECSHADGLIIKENERPYTCGHFVAYPTKCDRKDNCPYGGNLYKCCKIPGTCSLIHNKASP